MTSIEPSPFRLIEELMEEATRASAAHQVKRRKAIMRKVRGTDYINGSNTNSAAIAGRRWR